ncbi:MFS transporter [Thiomonas sp.]|jgi:AAHS family benzoate transporter-like MFS transporter/AAHS family 4-hydroxybenzoate transporter-like MFS transporter|uniref:MFS transporter n=1 Tax=Thiomonas sp. TaxID=2047785 RepID=UPI00262D6F10|nr:MFS transporter [Thiomonas sp.]
MQHTISPREEVGQAAFRSFHLRFALLVTLIMFFDGYDLFNAAYVIPLILKSWHPSHEMIGVMLSSGLVGLSIGSLLQGPLSDRFGRRKTLLLALWLLTATTLVLATAVHGPEAFAIARLAMGTALGMVTPLVLTSVNEWAPARYANTFATWLFQLGFSLGGISAGVFGLLLTPHFGWQSLYAVGGVSLLVALLATWGFPESVQYLMQKGRIEEVREALCRLRPERAQLYRNAELVSAHRARRFGSFGELFTAKYRRATLVSWVVGFFSLFCIQGLTGWLPTLVVSSGQAVSSAFEYGTIVMVASTFGGIGMGWTADRMGSRIRAMSVGYVLAALSMLCVGVALKTHWAGFLVAAAGFFIFGAQAVLNNYQAMSYHAEVRGTGMGMAVGVNRMGGVLGPMVVGGVATVLPGSLPIFGVFCVALLLAALLIHLGPREITAADAPQANAAHHLGEVVRPTA